MILILRRRKLGKTSCTEISNNMKNESIVIRNDQNIKNNNITGVIRWGCTSSLDIKAKVYNNSKAIHLVNNKTEFRKILQEHKLCPFTFFNVKDAVYPCVVRPSHHAQGRQLYVCDNIAELKTAITKCGDGWYGSQLINKTKEYRVFVGSGRAIWIVEKTPGNPKDVAWNVARGGRFDNLRFDNWNLKVVKTAIAAWELSGLDFGGIDIMTDSDNNCYVLEINSAPSQTSAYRQECTAKYFDYLINNGNEQLPLIKEKGGWKKFIHPCISNESLI